jgi:hypothetical protein
MTLLTDSQLDDICLSLIGYPYTYYPGTADWCFDLYNTGCRPNEILDYTRWLYVNDSDIQLTPLKGNSTRFFTSANLSIELYNAVKFGFPPYESLTLRQLEYNMYNALSVTSIGTINKSAIAYIYRYNYVKLLHNASVSDADILTQMGWSYPWLPYIYWSHDIYSTP